MPFFMFLTSKNPLVALSNETCALTSRKHVVEQGLNVRKSSGKHKLSFELLHFSLEK